MKITISSKGQIVIPSRFRKKLGIRAGEKLNFSLERPYAFKLELIRPKRAQRFKIKINKKTGFPYALVPPGSPIVTAKEVEAAMEEFP